MDGAPAQIYLDVRVHPRSSLEGIDPVRVAGRIRVRVNAAPVDNAANRAVVALVAKAFGVTPSRVEVVAGASGRDKRLRVRGPGRLPGWFAG